MKENSKRAVGVFFSVILLWVALPLRCPAGSYPIPKEFFLVAVEKETGTPIWEAYDHSGLPEKVRDEVPPDFFDTDNRRPSYRNWESRKNELLNGRKYVIENSGHLSCFDMNEGQDAKPVLVWKRDLIPDRKELAGDETPLKNLYSDLVFENFTTIWVATRFGVRQFDMDGKLLESYPPPAEIDLEKYDTYLSPSSHVELKVLPDGLLVRTNRRFFFARRESSKPNWWAIPHHAKGFFVRSIAPENEDILLLEMLDSTPLTLRWAIGRDAMFDGGLYGIRTQETALAGLDLLRQTGFGYNRHWLRQRLAEDWLDEELNEEKNQAPEFFADPLRLRLLYQKRIQESWEPAIEAILEKTWKPVRDPEALDRLCTEGLIEPHQPGEIFDRKLALAVLFERIYRIPNTDQPDSIHFQFNGGIDPATTLTEASQAALTAELRRILAEGPPDEQFAAAGILTAPVWEPPTTTVEALRNLMAHPGIGVWKWPFLSLLGIDERAVAVKAIADRPEADQIIALRILAGRFHGEHEKSQMISAFELDWWRGLFARHPATVAHSLEYSVLRLHLVPEIRAFLRLEAEERKLTDYMKHSGLMSLIRIVDETNDPADTRLIAKFADHPQWRERSLGTGEKEYWIRDRVRGILEKRGAIKRDPSQTKDPFGR